MIKVINKFHNEFFDLVVNAEYEPDIENSHVIGFSSGANTNEVYNNLVYNWCDFNLGCAFSFVYDASAKYILLLRDNHIKYYI